MNTKAKTAAPAAVAATDSDTIIGCLEAIATSLETLAAVAWVMIPEEKRASAQAAIEKLHAEDVQHD